MSTFFLVRNHVRHASLFFKNLLRLFLDHGPDHLDPEPCSFSASGFVLRVADDLIGPQASLRLGGA